MANPRRNSLANTNNNQSSIFANQTSTPTHANSTSSRIIHFLKKPHAFPFLLSVFLFLTWLSLKLQHTNSRFSPPTLARAQQTSNHHDHEDDAKAGLVRFPSGFPSPLAKDTRGWMLDPISLALTHHLSGMSACCISKRSLGFIAFVFIIILIYGVCSTMLHNRRFYELIFYVCYLICMSFCWF